jgi:hypothetical protein
MPLHTKNNPVLEGYFTIQELAKFLDPDVRTLQRWEVLGQGPPPTRIGSSVVYALESVKTWIKGQEKKPLPRKQKRRLGR